MEINLKLRSEILKCSLHLENLINELILLIVGIYSDKEKTKLFSNKSGNITFKNKIDLLYDLQILSSDENFDFNLLMTFRNKFLHDIDCDSFSNAFMKLGNPTKNKLAKFLEEGGNINNEKDCLSAFKRLFTKNIEILIKKVESKGALMHSKKELMQIPQEIISYQMDLFFDLMSEITLIVASADLYNKEIIELTNNILTVLNKFKDKYSNDEKYLSLVNRFENNFYNKENQKEFWNVIKSDSFEKLTNELEKEIQNTSK